MRGSSSPASSPRPPAETNSQPAEQGEWWAETAKCFDGDVRFTNSDDVDSFLAGGSNEAGFIQVMKGRGTDRDQMHTLDAQFETHAASFRHLLGGFRMWTGPDSYIEVAYFTNESEARQGESKEPPAEFAAQMGDFQTLMANVEFIDLREPWLF